MADDLAQDLVEYALLAGTIGLAGAAVWPLVLTAMNGAYVGMNSNSMGLWAPENPGGS